MGFIGPDKVIGQYSGDIKKSGIFSFPAGERLAQFELAGNSFNPTYAGDYVVVRPVTGAAVGLYDLNQKKFLFGNAKPALDGYGKVFVAERRDGEIGLFNVDTKEVLGSIALPPSRFGTFRASTVSADGNWLVASDRSRGAIWDLRTGERKLHVRNFRGAYISNDDKIFVDFPKQGKTERSIARMDPQGGTVDPIGDIISEATISQTGKYIVVQKALNDEPSKPAADPAPTPGSDTTDEIKTKPLPATGVLMELRDVRTGQLLWKREFINERPAIAISQIYDTMLLGWSLKSAAATQIIDSDPVLRSKRDKMGNKEGDQFIQAVDPNTGEVKGQFLLETGDRSFTPEYVRSTGDYLVINDNRNRILVYSMSSGELITRFFGSYPAISSDSNEISVENSPGRVTLFDIRNGKELGRLAFGHSVVFMQFMNKGAHLFIVTSDQTVYLFDTAKIGQSESADQ
jgi:outer membrane protein assembly factor BamB